MKKTWTCKCGVKHPARKYLKDIRKRLGRLWEAAYASHSCCGKGCCHDR